MLTDLALILLAGLLLGWLAKSLGLPQLVGMILLGIVIGPGALDLVGSEVLALSPDLRQLALVIILTRAGLSLDLSVLKKVGRPALLLSFLPASMEILGSLVLAPWLLGVSRVDALLIGCVLAAVSPAVVVPRMVGLIDKGYGVRQGIPQMILAGASLDDVFVMVVFTAILGLATTGQLALRSLWQVPQGILLGCLLGVLLGLGLLTLFRRTQLANPVKLVIVFSVSLLALEVQTLLEGRLAVSGLLAIMALAMVLRNQEPDLAQSLANYYNALWIPGEVFLFVLVGIAVDVRYAMAAGLGVVALIAGALAFRMLGTALSLVKTPLRPKERLFTLLAYTPKATVQAAIGAIPLEMGLASGPLVLTVAVVAILITAPLGALLIDRSYPHLLEGPQPESL